MKGRDNSDGSNLTLRLTGQPSPRPTGRDLCVFPHNHTVNKLNENSLSELSHRKPYLERFEDNTCLEPVEYLKEEIYTLRKLYKSDIMEMSFTKKLTEFT